MTSEELVILITKLLGTDLLPDTFTLVMANKDLHLFAHDIDMESGGISYYIQLSKEVERLEKRRDKLQRDIVSLEDKGRILDQALKVKAKL